MNNDLQFVPTTNIPTVVPKDTLFNISSGSVTTLTHGFHKYPSKFIPQIPQWAIKAYLNNIEHKLVLDPFCGSGTTLVEGLIAGQNVVGIDIDPLSTMISKVKTTPLEINLLNTVCDWVSNEIRNEKREPVFIPECVNLEHWFAQETIRKLSMIRGLIQDIPNEFGQTKAVVDIVDLLLICFSSVLRRVSNADNESQKTYVSHTNIKQPEEPCGIFLKQLSYFKKRITEFSLMVDPKLTREIICSSSLEDMSNIIGGELVDLAITSPPYIKAIDYIYTQMVELFWIGDLFGMQTQTKQNKKKYAYVGTKHLLKNDYAAYSPYDSHIGINKLDNKLQQIYDEDIKNGHKHAFITYKYFRDMGKHFNEVKNVLKIGAHYVVVVGDSSVSNVFFESSEFLVELANSQGFEMVNKWGYQIKNRFMRFDRKGRGGIISVDWVLDLVRT